MGKPTRRRVSPVLLASAVCVLAALATSDQAFGREAKPHMGECAAIDADRDRLACYDRASGRATSLGSSLPQPTALDAPAAAPPPAARSAGTDSMIDAAWGFGPDSRRYIISLYRPNYFQVAKYSSNPNAAPFEALFSGLETPDPELDSTEAEFQLSFKSRLWATDNRRFGVWLAYTQLSQWQVYNDELSRPFRETNYEPELMVSFRPGLSLGGVDWPLLNLGYNHQSNGRSDPISRSWDRLVAEVGIERGSFALLLRPWVIIDDGDDDNPDIEDFMGWGDLTAIYQWRGHTFTLMGRGNPSTDKGAARFTWSSPPLVGPIRAYAEAFTGYGESLIDYNWRQNTFGIGFALNDYLHSPDAGP